MPETVNLSADAMALLKLHLERKGDIPVDDTTRELYRELARDSYDNCIAYLDTKLGELFDELELRGVLRAAAGPELALKWLTGSKT